MTLFSSEREAIALHKTNGGGDGEVEGPTLSHRTQQGWGTRRFLKRAGINIDFGRASFALHRCSFPQRLKLSTLVRLWHD
jgi:hypothetical protein